MKGNNYIQVKFSSKKYFNKHFLKNKHFLFYQERQIIAIIK